MELSLTWNDQIKDVAGSPLDYSIGIGISDNTSEITKYDNPTLSLDETHYQGKKIGEIWGYVTDGFIKDEVKPKKWPINRLSSAQLGNQEIFVMQI